MIKVHREDGLREHLLTRANHRFEVTLVRILARALAELNDERRLALHIAFEQANGLFEVIDVVSAEGVFAVGDLEKLRGGNNHVCILLMTMGCVPCW